jgi:DNA topoisomerase-3
MTGKILCVAEKPSIAKAVAEHLSGGSYRTENGGTQYNKNYLTDFDFRGRWGHCDVVVTSVSGHMTGSDFPPQYRNAWTLGPQLEQLFDCQLIETVDEVSRKRL